MVRTPTLTLTLTLTSHLLRHAVVEEHRRVDGPDGKGARGVDRVDASGGRGRLVRVRVRVRV